MRIEHRVGFVFPEDSALVELRSLGFFEAGMEEGGVIKMREDDPRCASLLKWAADADAAVTSTTHFSRSEIAGADWLAVRPSWHHGYPQPEESHDEYLAEAYDLAEFCAACGIGLRQVRPFRMRGEPKWGARNILQLNWIFGEYFVRPEFWDAELRGAGVEIRQVMDLRHRELQSVVQLVPGETVSIKCDERLANTCASCGRTKYLHHTIGNFPAVTSDTTCPYASTDVEFGTDAVAYREILVQGAVAEAFRGRARGVKLCPAGMPRES